MRTNIVEEYNQFLVLICMFKVFHDAGITCFETPYYCNDRINEFDYYYKFVMEAIQSAAPIVINSENLYRKHGYRDMDDEVNIWAYSSKEMQKYYWLARKLYRLEGCIQKENPYIREIESKMDNIRGFESYSFDYFIGNKRKGAQLEILWGYDFNCDVALCLWIVRVMKLLKDELPRLQEKYRIARRMKRAKKKGVLNSEGKR